jgi:hypothetical protein
LAAGGFPLSAATIPTFKDRAAPGTIGVEITGPEAVT